MNNILELSKTFVNTIFPSRCLSCHELISEHGALCIKCWKSINFISTPICYKCGVPFEYNIGEQALCGRCMVQKPIYTEARAIFKYDENSKQQILALKYFDKTQLAPVFAKWLARISHDYKDKAHFIIPVPLHYFRLVYRRYNQASLLAKFLAKHIEIPIFYDALVRVKKTPTQYGLTRKQRDENMRGAFKVKPKHYQQLKGKSVILVDDVLTTGATLDACSRALHDAGVVDIFVVTLAHTVLVD